MNYFSLSRGEEGGHHLLWLHLGSLSASVLGTKEQIPEALLTVSVDYENHR